MKSWRSPATHWSPSASVSLVTDQSIESKPGGPLVVSGDVPLVRKTAVHSEHGEPLAWKTSDPLETRATYLLCRCGASANRPFCDGSHAEAGFDGADTADASSYDERANVLGEGPIVVRDDRSICVHAGFCGTRVTNIWKQSKDLDDSIVRLAVINEVEKCPSGAITYRFADDDDNNEADYPTQIAAIDDGPLWVTGEIPVTTSDGVELEARTRVTLCRCGASSNKPLCDGSHKEAGFQDS